RRTTPPQAPQDPGRQKATPVPTPLARRAALRLAAPQPTYPHPLRNQTRELHGIRLARLPPNPPEAFMRCALVAPRARCATIVFSGSRTPALRAGAADE